MASHRLGDAVLWAAVRAIEEHGSVAAAAKELGIPEATLQERQDRALEKGITSDTVTVPPMQPVIPDVHVVKGVSSLVSKDGEVVLQWVKTREDETLLLKAMWKALEQLKAAIPACAPSRTPEGCAEDLLSSYTLTDYHLGMMARAGEAGEEWSTQKSEEFLVAWFAAAIEAAPAAKVGILCQLGDFLHFDGLDPVTPTSRHVLDTDDRFQSLAGIAVRVLRRLVQMMLAKHEHVHIIMAEGNHDIASSVWLRVMFREFYRDEPRVTVDDSECPYYAYEWGLTSLFFHHGHKRGLKDLSKIFVGMFKELYGRTKYSYAHMGHMHHVAQKEDGLMVVEQHTTMAPKDAYAARGGYIANRGASVITYSRKHGEVSRITIRPEMVTA